MGVVAARPHTCRGATRPNLTAPNFSARRRRENCAAALDQAHCRIQICPAKLTCCIHTLEWFPNVNGGKKRSVPAAQVKHSPLKVDAGRRRLASGYENHESLGAFLLSHCLLGPWLEFTVSCQIGFLLAHRLVFQQGCASTPPNRGRTIETRTSAQSERTRRLLVGLSTYSELRGESGDKPDVFSPSWS